MYVYVYVYVCVHVCPNTYWSITDPTGSMWDFQGSFSFSSSRKE